MEWNFDRYSIPSFEDYADDTSIDEIEEVEAPKEEKPIVHQQLTIEDIDDRPAVELNYIGEKILDTSLHVVFSKEVTYKHNVYKFLGISFSFYRKEYLKQGNVVCPMCDAHISI